MKYRPEPLEVALSSPHCLLPTPLVPYFIFTPCWDGILKPPLQVATPAPTFTSRTPSWLLFTPLWQQARWKARPLIGQREKTVPLGRVPCILQMALAPKMSSVGKWEDTQIPTHNRQFISSLELLSGLQASLCHLKDKNAFQRQEGLFPFTTHGFGDR